eukprot:475565-Rhodomonas_salina.1
MRRLRLSSLTSRAWYSSCPQRLLSLSPSAPPSLAPSPSFHSAAFSPALSPAPPPAFAVLLCCCGFCATSESHTLCRRKRSSLSKSGSATSTP